MAGCDPVPGPQQGHRFVLNHVRRTPTAGQWPAPAVLWCGLFSRSSARLPSSSPASPSLLELGYDKLGPGGAFWLQVGIDASPAPRLSLLCTQTLEGGSTRVTQGVSRNPGLNSFLGLGSSPQTDRFKCVSVEVSAWEPVSALPPSAAGCHPGSGCCSGGAGSRHLALHQAPVFKHLSPGHHK